jgi:hypothetical protein
LASDGDVGRTDGKIVLAFDVDAHMASAVRFFRNAQFRGKAP